MNHSRVRLRIYIAILVAVMVLGTVVFMHVENLSLLDSVYFTIVTIATVGFGDIHPVTDLGKLLCIVLIITGVGTFLGVVANGTEVVLNRREKALRLEKLSMIIGLFFSEAGTRLLRYCVDADPHLDGFRDVLIVKDTWSARDYLAAREKIRGYSFQVNSHSIDLPEFRLFLKGQGELFIRMLENPYMIEHENFTDLIIAILHLKEELESREGIADLPEGDYDHLAGDLRRVYGQLVGQWLSYMEYLQGNYPFLFSLAVRKNPFDRTATPVIGM